MPKFFSIKMVPSFITMGNVCCGFLAIAFIAEGHLATGAWCIFFGMIFDVLDGKVARLTNGSSDFGMQLDSLADMISFGLAPAFLAKVFLTDAALGLPAAIVWVAAALFLLCAASRLARFNVTTNHDESSHMYFQGLATPAAAGVVASLVLLSHFAAMVMPIAYYKVAVLLLTFLLAFFMVSSIRYRHMGVLLLKKSKVIVKVIALALFVTVVAIEPQVFVVTIAAAFISYAFAAPTKNLCKLLFTSSVEQAAQLEELSGTAVLDDLSGNGIQPHSM